MTKEQRDVEAALDLRAFTERLEQAGKLKEIRGAHWDLEIGALTEDRGGIRRGARRCSSTPSRIIRKGAAC